MNAYLYVKKLDPRATQPTVAYPGEDLGYDVYASQDAWLFRDKVTRVHTGIAVSAVKHDYPMGLIMKDRSSMANKGVFVHGGVIDSGYTGEIMVSMTTHNVAPYLILEGVKFCQMVPVPVLTGEVIEVQELEPGHRGENGHGSTGV